jgi:hypothetical protein
VISGSTVTLANPEDGEDVTVYVPAPHVTAMLQATTSTLAATPNHVVNNRMLDNVGRTVLLQIDCGSGKFWCRSFEYLD